MYIAGAKFKENLLNTSKDILDRVLCCFSGTTYDGIAYDAMPFLRTSPEGVRDLTPSEPPPRE